MGDAPTTRMKSSRPGLRPILVRLWRLGLLAAAVLIIRDAVQTRENLAAARALAPERLRDFFPAIHSLGPASPANGWRTALDASDQTLGYATTTRPGSEKIIGYSGPSHSLLVFDLRGALKGLRLLKSHDTTEHVAEVVADRKFFTQFQNLKPGEGLKQPLHIVTGATLTSTAIAQGVLEKLGQAASSSLRFPDEITLAEVERLEPDADKLTPSSLHRGGLDVLDAAGRRIGIAVRTSPVSDSIVGYKGPTDTLMLLSADGTTLKKIALRKSYDTKRYVAYVTGDSYFLNLFNNSTLEKMAGIDFKEAGVEGVSGATETSWSVAEGLKQRARSLLDDQPTGWLRQIRWRWQDAGHLLVLASAFLMAFTRLRGRPWLRHAHHAFLVIYGGFVVGELLSQGLLVGWAAHGIPWKSAPGLLLLGVVALLAPVFTSRQLYCHHLCPHGALQQLLARRLPGRWNLPPRVEAWLQRMPFALLTLVLATAVLELSVDLNALEAFDAYQFRIAGPASLAIALIGLVASLFQPLAYCKYGCPTGALFKLLRFTGDADRLGSRDWLAAALLAAAALA
jgi:NosR/NirI family nitrous oxide reductase transcriptional regulator